MRIGVIGSGALGTLFAGYLSQVADVALLGRWPDQIAALRRHGLCLRLPAGETRHARFAIHTDLNGAIQVDIAVVLVKSSQTRQAATAARQWLAPRGVALTLQNGVGNAALLRAVLGPERVVEGITTVGATVDRPGHTRQVGPLAVDLEQRAAFLPDFLALLEAAGCRVALHDNLAGLIWGKLALNAAINPLTALLDVDNGVVAEQATGRFLLATAAEETAAVAAALDIDLPYADPAAEALRIARATAANRSSMRQDLNRGAVTEIDAICGAVVAHGLAQGVQTPLNALYTRLVPLARSRGRAAALQADAQSPAESAFLQKVLWLHEEYRSRA